MKPTREQLHSLSGVFFYDEQARLYTIERHHVMTHTLETIDNNHVHLSSCWCVPEIIYEDESGYECWGHHGRC